MVESEVVAQFTMDKLQGIVEDTNCFYIPVRVTGTGKTIRYNEDTEELFVEERLKSAYFTPEVLKACSRLPITLEHPKGMLNSDTLDTTRIIGLTIDAKVVGEEIWALAKIYDKSLIEKFGGEINSTSPGIFSFVGKMSEQDSSQQEVPIEINHLAFVKAGHWDQKGTKGFDDSQITKIQEERMDSMDKTQELPLDDMVTEVVAPEVDEVVETKGEAAEVAEVVETKDEAAEVAEVVETKDEAAEVAEVVETKDEATEVIDSSEATEIIDSDCEEKLDAERDSLLSKMRVLCDTAHPNLALKMPFIEKRETPRSVVAKFMRRNPAFVNKKYYEITLEALTDELAVEIFNEMQKGIEAANQGYVSKPLKGFVDTSRGYSVDSQF